MYGEMKPLAPWFQVRFDNLDREAECNEGETIFHSARRAGVRIVGACGGRGVCGSCIVRIVSGNFDVPESESPGAGTAPRAGIDCLLRDAALEEDAIERVVIAGAFGAYIGLPAAVRIGMLPAVPLSRIEQVGNAAGVGVRMALASAALRDRARCLALRCRYLELGSLPDFQRVFMRRIGFE